MSVSGIYAEIYKKFIAGEAKLPSLPDVVVKIRDAVRDPNSSAKTVARLLQADPALTAYLLKVVNSPFFMTRVHPQKISKRRSVAWDYAVREIL